MNTKHLQETLEAVNDTLHDPAYTPYHLNNPSAYSRPLHNLLYETITVSSLESAEEIQVTVKSLEVYRESLTSVGETLVRNLL